MAHFKKILRTTNCVEELLKLVDNATKLSLKSRRSPQWEWREVKAASGYYTDEVFSCNGALMQKNLLEHVRFSGRLTKSGLTVVVLVLIASNEYWHAPYGEDSYDDYGDGLSPKSIWIQTKTRDGNHLLTKRFSVTEYGEISQRKTQTPRT